MKVVEFEEEAFSETFPLLLRYVGTQIECFFIKRFPSLQNQLQEEKKSQSLRLHTAQITRSASYKCVQ